MRAALLREFEKPLSVEEVDVQDPQPGEVVVRLAASGVCRSDLHVLEGTSPVARLPMILGHEGAGVIEEVGEGVREFAKGDPVVIALYGPCGTCPQCRAGDIANCWSETRTHNMYGEMPDGSTRLSVAGEVLHPMCGAGSLAEISVVRESQLVGIAPDIPLELACLVGCGVTTGIGAALNTARVQPGSTVAVIGCGGVGLNVIQGCRIAGAARIVAVDLQQSKLDLASDFGATDCLKVEAGQSASEAIRALFPAGVDYAFEVIGLVSVVREAFEATRTGGTAIQVGAPPPGDEIAIDARLLFSDRKLLGCMGGGNVPQRDIPRIMALYRQGSLNLEKLVSQTLSLDEVNVAFDALRQGELARSVIRF